MDQLPRRGVDLRLSGLSTGVGSMPQVGAEPAIAVVERCCPSLPFWPQLPGRSAAEGMISQGLSGLEPWLTPLGDGPGYTLEHTLLDRRALVEPPPWGVAEAEGLVAMETALAEGRFAGAIAIKGQLAGPITLASCLRWRGEPGWRDPELLRMLGVRVAWQAVDQLVRLRARGHRVLIVVDEPMLGLLPTDALAPEGAPMEALAWTLGAVRASGGLTGLHCCSAPPWSALLELPLDLMSFDAHADLDSLLASPSGRALAERRWMAWGLVPTSGDPAALDAEEIAARWRARVGEAMQTNALARTALVTPTCGLAGLSPAHAEAALDLAARVGALIGARTSAGVAR